MNQTKNIPACEYGLVCPHCRNIAFGLEQKPKLGEFVFEIRRIYGKRPKISKPTVFCQHCYGDCTPVGGRMDRAKVVNVEEFMDSENALTRGYKTYADIGIPMAKDVHELVAQSQGEGQEEIEAAGGAIVKGDESLETGVVEGSEVTPKGDDVSL